MTVLIRPDLDDWERVVIDELPPPSSELHLRRIRDLARAVVVSESAPETREALLDALFAAHSPSLHGDWTTACSLCEPAQQSKSSSMPSNWCG